MNFQQIQNEKELIYTAYTSISIPIIFVGLWFGVISMILTSPGGSVFTFPTVEKKLILLALKTKNWNQTLVAKLLNISRNSVISNM